MADEYRQAIDTARRLRAQGRLEESSIVLAALELDGSAPAAQRTMVLVHRAERAWSLGRFDESDAYMRKAEVLFSQARADSDVEAYMAACANMGHFCALVEEREIAIDYYNLGMAVAQNNGDKCSWSILLKSKAGCLYELGDMEDALECAERSLEFHVEVFGGRDWRCMAIETLIGDIYSDRGDVHKGVAKYRRAMPILEEHHGKFSIAMADHRSNFAQALEQAGDLKGCAVQLEESAAILRHLGAENVLSRTETLIELAEICLRLEQPERARMACLEARDLLVASGLESCAEYEDCVAILERL